MKAAEPGRTRVGFVGLGLMGLPMARNVLQAGFPLTVYNRTTAKAVPLTEAGAAQVASPGEVAERSDVVVTMVTDSPDVEAVVAGPKLTYAISTPQVRALESAFRSLRDARDTPVTWRGIGELA